MTGILFDLDGTLLDTLDDLTDSTNHVLAQFGYPVRTKEEICRFVGNGAGVLMAKAVPAGADSTEPLDAFRRYYADHCRVKTKPYDGICEALDALKRKYPIAIVSNKPDSAVKPLCSEFFPGIYAQGQTDTMARKPAPDMVYAAMEAIGADRCIYVGDSEVDVRTGHNAGCPVLSVEWGFRTREEIGGAKYCGDPSDLVAALEEMIEELK